MKKFISLLISCCLTFCFMATTAFAADESNAVKPDITLAYVYADDVKVTAKWTGTNSITYTCEVKGLSTATQIKIYLYLEEYNNGIWKQVDYVTKTVSGKSTTASKTYNSASKSKDYRAHASVYVYSGSAYEHIEKYSTTI